MGDFFAFRRMLAPLLIHLIFWIGVLGSLAVGGAIIGGQIDPAKYLPATLLADLKQHMGNLNLIAGLIILIGGPIFIRLYCELLMLPFRINGTLTDIRNTLREQRGGATTVPSPATLRR